MQKLGKYHRISTEIHRAMKAYIVLHSDVFVIFVKQGSSIQGFESISDESFYRAPVCVPSCHNKWEN